MQILLEKVPSWDSISFVLFDEPAESKAGT